MSLQKPLSISYSPQSLLYCAFPFRSCLCNSAASFQLYLINTLTFQGPKVSPSESPFYLEQPFLCFSMSLLSSFPCCPGQFNPRSYVRTWNMWIFKGHRMFKRLKHAHSHKEEQQNQNTSPSLIQ